MFSSWSRHSLRAVLRVFPVILIAAIAMGVSLGCQGGAAGAGTIFEAAGDGDLARVEALLQEHPEFVDAAGPGGLTPLHWAAREGREQVVAKLLLSGAPVNAVSEGGDRATPLHEAAGGGHARVADILLKAGAELDAWDREKRTPLHWAAYAPSAETVKLLLDRGADPDVRDERRQTPLHRAALKESLETVKVLVAAGARTRIEDERQRTPLDCVHARRRPVFREVLYGDDEQDETLVFRQKSGPGQR